MGNGSFILGEFAIGSNSYFGALSNVGDSMGWIYYKKHQVQVKKAGA